ncbi:MAG: hypothetical protein IT563_12040 [Alphaproteobacteria bacterium]|nr:hypothetical protein [Alphaproteobacteria bacterium]
MAKGQQRSNREKKKPKKAAAAKAKPGTPPSLIEAASGGKNPQGKNR